MSGTELDSTKTSKQKPVLIMAAVIAAMNVVLAGLTAADVVEDKWFALFNLIVAAITVAYGVLTNGQVAPWSQVVAKATPQGDVVAGPASVEPTGSSVVVTPVLPPSVTGNPG